jgi:hypothetical protein
MHNLSHILLAIALGLLLGLGSAYLALEQQWGFDRVSAGPWIGTPRAGGVDADPYSRAQIVKQASLPLGGGEGVAFVAEVDSQNRSLTANCSYVVKGGSLPTRWWTITVSDANGALFTNPLNRYGFTSQEITRNEKGDFEIAVASRVQPGNWIPAPPDGPIRITLRFYDTPLTNSSGIDAQELPSITREECS